MKICVGHSVIVSVGVSDGARARFVMLELGPELTPSRPASPSRIRFLESDPNRWNRLSSRYSVVILATWVPSYNFTFT